MGPPLRSPFAVLFSHKREEIKLRLRGKLMFALLPHLDAVRNLVQISAQPSRLDFNRRVHSMTQQKAFLIIWMWLRRTIESSLPIEMPLVCISESQPLIRHDLVTYMYRAGSRQAIQKTFSLMGSFKIPRAFFLSPWKRTKKGRRSSVWLWSEEGGRPLNGMPPDDDRC